MTCRQQIDRRQSELAKIHIAKKQLEMDDATYRDMLFTVARVRSAKDLDQHGRHTVLDHLKAIGFKSSNKNHPGRPRNINGQSCAPLLKKIEAYLAEAGRPWTYVQAMAKHMFKVDRLEFCTADQLHRIVAALEYDARRHGRASR